MSNELLDSVRSAFPETLIAKFSTLLGESEVNTIKAIHGSIPIVLTDILHKAYFPEGIGKVNTLARQAVTSDFFGQLHELNVGNGVLVAGSSLLNKGTDFSKALLAGRTDAVVNEISRYSNTSISSAAFIVGLVCLGALDAIGRYLTHSSVDGNSLSVWIKAQGDSIVHAIPVGLEVKAALGIQHYPWEKRAQKSRNSVLYAIIVVIIVAVAALLIYRSYQQKEAASTTAADTTATAAAPTVNTDTTTAPRSQINLPDGHVIDATRGGTEDRLIAFLSDPNAPIDKKNGNWFDLTKVGFVSNSASLLPESETQLRNIVSILDAFPKARIKIGGNTDNTGDAAANVRLSQKRADHILAKLKDLGVKHSQLAGAEGSGRAMDRRMSIEVKAK
jgi:outer membrane protein OmpA-like peptidoglycan-associated protein